MATKSLPYGVHTVILHSKLLTCLPDDGCDERVVCLVDPREQVMCGLVIESTSDHRPKPTVCSIVLRGSHLHLCPGGEKRGKGRGRRLTDNDGCVLYSLYRDTVAPG